MSSENLEIHTNKTLESKLGKAPPDRLIRCELKFILCQRDAVCQLFTVIAFDFDDIISGGGDFLPISLPFLSSNIHSTSPKTVISAPAVALNLMLSTLPLTSVQPSQPPS